MAGRVVFTVRSPLGYQVTLTRDRWREIIRYKHPALAGSGRAVRGCVEAPMIVRESIKNASVHLYYTRAGQVYLCVAVAPSDEQERFVVTTYFTRNIKKGRELWTN